MKKKAIVICGPTASGKTVLAHEIAGQYKGQIVGCDSAQLYRQLSSLSDSPPNLLKMQLPYHLYNFLDLSQSFSAAQYASCAWHIVRNITKDNDLPIITGGTGLYLNYLLYGYNYIPEIPEEIRQEAVNLYEKLDHIKFIDYLKTLDKQITEDSFIIKDKQRSIRAYEIIRATGQSIIEISAKAKKINDLEEYEFLIILLLPERSILYERCNKRVPILFANSLDEMVNLEKYNKEFIYNAEKKIIGAKEILYYLNKKISKEEAIALTQNRTRQYAKRQITWFKYQIKDKLAISNIEEEKNKLKEIIKAYLAK